MLGAGYWVLGVRYWVIWYLVLGTWCSVLGARCWEACWTLDVRQAFLLPDPLNRETLVQLIQNGFIPGDAQQETTTAGSA